MNKPKLYHYPKCSSCKSAVKLLASLKINPQLIDIAQQPPSLNELRRMLTIREGKLHSLFNTSGMQYRELGMKEKLPTLTTDEALELLSTNGMLVKRPFFLAKDVGLLGFKEDTWRTALAKFER